MLTLLAVYGRDRWSVTIAKNSDVSMLCGRNGAVVVLESRDHHELEQKGGALLMHITRTAIAEPTLFGRELVLAAIDSFMRLPARPTVITPVTIY